MPTAAHGPSTTLTITNDDDGLERLRGFGSGWYACTYGWADACFELCEALLCASGPISSVPSLSLEPCFRRFHGSLYKALGRATIDAEAMRDLLVAHRPPTWPLVFAVDESTWARCDAETSPGRGFYYSASTHSAGQPIVAGWSYYQWITQLDWACDSWTAPMDAARIPPTADGVAITVGQIRDLATPLENTSRDQQAPTFVFDAGYDPVALTHGLVDVAATIVVRIRDDRVFYADPPPATGTVGRPRRHGSRRGCAEPESWPAPDYEASSSDERYGTVHVAAWHDLHPTLGRRGRWANLDQPPIVAGTIVRVDVQHLPKPISRTKKTLWLWVASGAGLQADLDLCWRAYLRRFDIEHTFRFAKDTLGWTTPSVRTPEQADTWTGLVVAAYTQLRLARRLVANNGLPWERRAKPGRLTPARVRRGFRRTAPTLGTPARPPKSRRLGPGPGLFMAGLMSCSK